MTLLEAAGYRCTRSGANLGAFDVIGVGSADVVLVQVKTRDWPGSVEMEQLRLFTFLLNCRKLIHRWRDRVRLPQMEGVVSQGVGIRTESRSTWATTNWRERVSQ